MHVCLSSEPQGLICSDQKIFSFDFILVFSIEYNSKTQISKDLEFIRGEIEFYLDVYETVRFCNSRAQKQSVDEIKRKRCTSDFEL